MAEDTTLSQEALWRWILKCHGVVRQENPVIAISGLTHLDDRARERELLGRLLVEDTLDDSYVGLKN
jgi:hypothetical protein